MNFRIMSLVAAGVSFAGAIFWLFCIISGSNADGIREAAFIEIQRDFGNMQMLNPVMNMGGMNGMSMGTGMGGMPGLNGMVPAYKLTLALRAWCIYQYKNGFGMPTPLWADFGDLPSYEVKLIDDSVIQCVHPRVALNDQRIVMTMAQVIGLQNPMMSMGMRGGFGGDPSGLMFDRGTTLYYGLEAIYYMTLIFSVLTGAIALTAITMRRRLLPLISTCCGCVVLILGIIAFSIWTFVFSRLESYITIGNIWSMNAFVRLGTSYWLTVVGCILSIVVVIACAISIVESRKSTDHEVASKKVGA